MHMYYQSQCESLCASGQLQTRGQRVKRFFSVACWVTARWTDFDICVSNRLGGVTRDV